MFPPVVAAESMPALGWLILVPGLYAVVFVPLVLWGLARANHRVLGWIILPFFSLLLTAGMWLYVHQQVTG